MGWKNRIQLSKEYTDSGSREKFAQLFALRLFLQDCFVEKGYNAPETFGQAVSLSPVGQELFLNMESTFAPAQIKLALFVAFSHHDLFIDLDNTNTEAIQNTLHEEIVGGKIRYPWVYDRCLYDRFFRMFPTQTEYLPYEDTLKLLENTPQGVFQVRDIIVGPFGILRSHSYRYLPPKMKAPLWHCSDPSCGALHTVRITTGDTAISEIVEIVYKRNVRSFGPPSEWKSFFSDCLDFHKWYDDQHTGTFPWLLANAFSETELRTVLCSLLRTHSKEIRQSIPQTRNIQNCFQDSPERIVTKLSKSQCFQLALLVSDDILISTIETLVEDHAINIPSTEVRRPVFWGSTGNWLVT